MVKKLIFPKALVATILLSSFFSALCFAQELPRQGESISIVTYYPSPYGSYNQLSVAAGGLRLGKALEKVPAHKWTDIDANPMPAGGLYIITVVPDDNDPFITYMVLFSAGPRGVELIVFPGAIAESAPQNMEDLSSWRQKRLFAQFRAQKSTSQDSFLLQIRAAKECSVHVGKTLSYWAEHNQ
ncbi:MAG: hypothetical protein AB1530_06405 [Candidatus Omnitrophota bacterium]